MSLHSGTLPYCCSAVILRSPLPRRSSTNQTLPSSNVNAKRLLAQTQMEISNSKAFRTTTCQTSSRSPLATRGKYQRRAVGEPVHGVLRNAQNAQLIHCCSERRIPCTCLIVSGDLLNILHRGYTPALFANSVKPWPTSVLGSLKLMSDSKL
jgi:hypothetical protein